MMKSEIGRPMIAKKANKIRPVGFAAGLTVATISVLLCVGCLLVDDASNAVPTAAATLASTLLTEEEALAIAKRELGDYGYDHDAPIVVRRGPDYFDFIFPEPHHGPPDDDDYYGADFAARVRIDSRTGAVVEIEAGG